MVTSQYLHVHFLVERLVVRVRQRRGGEEGQATRSAQSDTSQASCNHVPNVGHRCLVALLEGLVLAMVFEVVVVGRSTAADSKPGRGDRPRRPLRTPSCNALSAQTSLPVQLPARRQISGLPRTEDPTPRSLASGSYRCRCLLPPAPRAMALRLRVRSSALPRSLLPSPLGLLPASSAGAVSQKRFMSTSPQPPNPSGSPAEKAAAPRPGPTSASSAQQHNHTSDVKTSPRLHDHGHQHKHDHSGHSHSINPFASHSHSHGPGPSPSSLVDALTGKGDPGSRVTLYGLASNVGLTALKLVAGWCVLHLGLCRLVEVAENCRCCSALILLGTPSPRSLSRAGASTRRPCWPKPVTRLVTF